MGVRKSSHERLQEHYSGYVAHQVRQHGGNQREDTEMLQIEMRAESSKRCVSPAFSAPPTIRKSPVKKTSSPQSTSSYTR